MLLATGSEKGSVRLWNREGQNLRTNPQHMNRVLVLKWNRRSTLLASGGLDRVSNIDLDKSHNPIINIYS
jgi:WD40 repeat protein